MAYGMARDAFGREIVQPDTAPGNDPFGSGGSGGAGGSGGYNGNGAGAGAGNGAPAAKKESATDAIGRRAGALSDELDFPAFVSSLVHGTFDAMVDSSIRQMQSFADLVAAVAKPLDQFTQENVTLNQARDYLLEQYPRDVTLVQGDGAPMLAPIARPGEDEGPSWLADYGHEGAELSSELLEQELLPKARERLAKSRLQTLSTMVLMGMNRIVIKDGTIGARLRFRAAAADHAQVQIGVGDQPNNSGEAWTARGSGSAASTKVSTVGVNVQSDSELKAELFGEVKINFASETVPLDRFLDDATRNLLERHSRKQPTSLPPRAASAPATAQLPPPSGAINDGAGNSAAMPSNSAGNGTNNGAGNGTGNGAGGNNGGNNAGNGAGSGNPNRGNP
jgi:hypothetical protein